MNDKIIQDAVAVLTECSQLAESKLCTLYADRGGCDSVLDRAAKYSLMAGGKRVRPALVFEFCRLFGGNPEDAIPFAAAVEMVHTSTLIHDDMPILDNDDMRRGKPTNHKVFGEAVALLTGDAMAMDAYKMLVSADNIPAPARIEAVRLLSEAAGESGVMRGQIIDMYGEENKLTMDELLRLHAHKTGALIRVSAQLGVLASGRSVNSDEMMAAVAYAENIGLAFQVVDDILDVTSSSEVLGKNVGSDMENNKNTFMSFMSVDEAQSYADELTDKATAAIEGYDNSYRLCAVARYLAVRKN